MYCVSTGENRQVTEILLSFVVLSLGWWFGGGSDFALDDHVVTVQGISDESLHGHARSKLRQLCVLVLGHGLPRRTRWLRDGYAFIHSFMDGDMMRMMIRGGWRREAMTTHGDVMVVTTRGGTRRMVTMTRMIRGPTRPLTRFRLGYAGHLLENGTGRCG